MQFRQVVGQQEIKERLIKSVKEGRISHAQLFLGPEGSGNMAMAIAYAQYICCENRNDNDSCGTCPSCRKYEKLEHPDLHFVYPVATTKAVTKDPISDDFIKLWREIVLQNSYLSETMWYDQIGMENKQGQIGKSESEIIIRKLSMKSYEADYKVMIIWLPEKMNITCANKLLKMIEEPPAKTLFFLVAQNSELIIQTILSRTQLVKFPKIDSESMAEGVKLHYNLNDGDVEDVIHLANGSFLRASQIIGEDEDNRFNYEQFVALMRLSYSRKIIDLIRWAEKMATIGREKQKNFLSYALRLVRENFVMNYQHPEMIFMTRQENQFSEKFSPFIQEWNIHAITEELNKAYMHVERNGNGKVILLDFALKLVKLIRK